MINSNSVIHGSSLVLATVVGGFFSYFFAKKNNFELKNLEDYLLITFIAGVIGARLFYYFAYKDQFSGIADLFAIWNGGLVSWGGFIFGSLSMCVILKIKKEPILKWLDFLSFGLMLGLIIGRIGDFASGESNGQLSLGAFHLAESLGEALLAALILITIVRFWHKLKAGGGLTFAVTVLLYGGGRFVLDFGRTEEKLFLHISLGQVLDLTVLIFAFLLIFFLEKRKRSSNVR